MKKFHSPPITSILVSDLHGEVHRYQKLFKELTSHPPQALFIAGDLFPHALTTDSLNFSRPDFAHDLLETSFKRLRSHLGCHYPTVFVILGNDDPRFEEPFILDLASQGLCYYVHMRALKWNGFTIFGYNYVPPTPFHLKDWERYDVSRFVDPGCLSPEEGFRTVPVSEQEARFSTIAADLERLAADHYDFQKAVFLFHSPPYQTMLDRAALDDQAVDHAPLDIHIGSIAIQRFIQIKQPMLSLHGHVHESAHLTGSFKDSIGRTVLLSAAHSGPELALIEFDLSDPIKATRRIL